MTAGGCRSRAVSAAARPRVSCALALEIRKEKMRDT